MEMPTHRGLSQNKKVVTKEKSSMSEKTLIGIRLTKDAVDSAGGHPTNIVLTQPLLGCCGSAHKVYKAALEETKEKDREKKRKREQIEAERQMEEKKGARKIRESERSRKAK